MKTYVTLGFLVLLTGCYTDARVVCADRLGIPQDENHVYLSRTSESMHIAFAQCVGEVEEMYDARRRAAGAAISAAGQNFSTATRPTPQVSCQSYVIGQRVYTDCR